MNDDLKTVITKIEALTCEPGFIYTLALILLRDLFLDPNEAADMNWYEHLSFQELTFLTGLLVKHEINFDIPGEEESEKRFQRVYGLFNELHQKYNEPIVKRVTDNIVKDDPARSAGEGHQEIFGSGDSLVESIFYAGSGAFDFQYLEFAVKKYANDAEWLLKNIGLDLPAAANIVRALKEHEVAQFVALRPQIKPGNFQKTCQTALSIFCFTPEDMKKFEPNTDSFLKTFSLTPGKSNQKLEVPGQYNELQSKPIVQLPDGRYFLPIGFNLSESIYESPFYWMNKDLKYVQEALRHRGESAEEIVAALLKRTFGEKNVYTRVEVKKDKETIVTDIDVLAIAGNKAIIAQVKSKRLTELSKTGDEKTLNKDFEGAVQEAYDQGLLSRAAVVDKANKLFLNGTELVLKQKIDDAYILCLTLDHYPSVVHQVDVFLRKKEPDPFPIAISIFDLDIITFYLTDPFEFLYYIRQRTKFYQLFHADSEMTFLAVHLKHKLFPRKGPGGEKVDMQCFDNSFAQLIDANFPALRGSAPKTKAAEKLYPEWKNEDFNKLIDQVKETNEPGFTDAIFLLYDLAGKGADQLIDAIKAVKEKTLKDGKRHDARAVYDEDKQGVTIMAAQSFNELRSVLYSHSILSKYRTKADIWLSIGSIAGSPNFVDILGFNKVPWKYDAELDQMEKGIYKIPTQDPPPTVAKVGRNDPCPCGSGRKYKKCHGT